MAERTVVHVRLVFADRGTFHEILLDVPADILAHYSRLIDALREDPEINAGTYIDFRRLVAARIDED